MKYNKVILIIILFCTYNLLAQKKESKLKNLHIWGGEEIFKDSLFLYNATDLEIDEDGNYYIVDTGNNCVRVFNDKRKYIRTIGRKGKGPNEFINPVSIAMLKNNILIGDSDLRRINFYDRGLNYVKSINNNNILYDKIESMNGNIYLKNKVYKNFSPYLISVYNSEFKYLSGVKKANLCKNKHKVENFYCNLIDFSVDENHIVMAYTNYLPIMFNYSNKATLIDSVCYELDLKPKDISFKDGNITGSQPFLHSIEVDGNDNIYCLIKKRYLNQSELKIVSSMSVGNSTIKEKTDENYDCFNIFKILVFNQDGRLIHEEELDFFVDKLKIIQNKMFLFDYNYESKIYECELNFN